MTIYFLKLKELCYEIINSKNQTAHEGIYAHMFLMQISRLEAEFECKSLSEAGYF